MGKDRTTLGQEIEAGLREAIAHRGETALEGRLVTPMSADRVKSIRKRVAKSSKEFERRFGVPARTVEGWEQGRKLDVAGRILMTVIEQNPEAVEQALTKVSD
jgi:putative transcriptional regulator